MNWRTRFRSPDFWIFAFALMGALGAVLLVASKVIDSSALKTIGLVLVAPILLGAVLAILVVPFVMAKRTDEEE